MHKREATVPAVVWNAKAWWGIGKDRLTMYFKSFEGGQLSDQEKMDSWS